MNFTPRQLAAFWAKVERGPGCWMWMAASNRSGYGVFGKPQYLAHRIAYTLIAGPIPKGALVMHACDTPGCVNPAHLRVGSHADNMRDMSSKKRRSGTCNPRSKLVESQVLAIRRARGERHAEELAAMYPITVGQVKMIWSRKSWSHLPGCWTTLPGYF